ncbi:flagellin [Methanoculleus sp. Wushi-C6]|uniref:Flagellin n=1 Tax=Methanoculleus caldifontis TaxID=2651577 RepID=A0ABU3X4J6_9EURY|nr:archaellin/type IV pilin N-terminal domain-containing protein [Methanoculleus sp. Wushi-C6]MDV2482346.1 flagellin [Methanoculleus sp. Wushi-C6]
MLTIKSDNAFTGLEAAIVLIAFVVVAAVFSYVVLGAGFFTTQKSQEVVHTSVGQTSSSLEVVGNVYGAKNANVIDTLRFDVGLTAGGSPVDMSKTVLTYSNATNLEYLAFKDGGGEPGAGQWTVFAKAGGDTDNLLEAGEIFTLKAKVTTGFPVNDKARLELKPPVGAVLGLQRTAPPQLDTWNVLK